MADYKGQEIVKWAGTRRRTSNVGDAVEKQTQISCGPENALQV